MVGALQPDPDPRVAGRVLHRVAQQVLDDPLDHRGVGRDRERRDVERQAAARRRARSSRRSRGPSPRGRPARTPVAPARAGAARGSGSPAPGRRACARSGRCAARGRASRSTGRSRSSRSSVTASPRIAASGVRRSCETACRNVDFISSSARSRSASSRSRSRSRSSAWRRCCSVTSTSAPLPVAGLALLVADQTSTCRGPRRSARRRRSPGSVDAVAPSVSGSASRRARSSGWMIVRPELGVGVPRLAAGSRTWSRSAG